jgi:hypothetical protein
MSITQQFIEVNSIEVETIVHDSINEKCMYVCLCLCCSRCLDHNHPTMNQNFHGTIRQHRWPLDDAHSIVLPIYRFSGLSTSTHKASSVL